MLTLTKFKYPLILLGSLTLGVAAFVSEAAAQSEGGRSAGPLVVNIDNPNFRKLVVAVPSFIVADESDEQLKELAAKGATEITRLLSFSGLFNVMAENAYAELMRSMRQPQARTRLLQPPDGGGMAGIEATQWRGLGIESLTVGVLSRDGDGITLSLRTADINRNELLLGRRYRRVSESDFSQVMRRYADLILEAYTGRPGIFNSKIVFIGRRGEKDEKHVFIADFDGSNLEQITSGKGPHVSPSWSHDGKFLVFTSYRDGNPDLFTYEIATKRMRKVSGHAGINSGGAFTHNNRLIAFSGSVGRQVDLYTTTPEGAPRQLFIRGSGVDAEAAFSPNGEWIAFVSGRYGNPHIFRGSLKWDGDSKASVVEDRRLTYVGWYNAAPAWSPNSDKIAFAGYDRDIDRFDIFMMNPDGSNIERLTLRAGDNEHPSWSPNGQMLVYASNRVGQRDVKGRSLIFVMNRDGSSQRSLDINIWDAQQPGWSPQLD